jgi:putative resolvase
VFINFYELMPYVDKWVQMCYLLGMKLSQYARQQGISYRTALRWFRAGTIKGYQAPTGTIIVTEVEAAPARPEQVAIYARVSSPEHRDSLERQVARLSDYCAARGYQVAQTVKEIASGVNDNRPKLLALLKDTSVTRIVVEHRDRLTRFGFHYLEALLQAQGRPIEVVNLAQNDKEDLIADLVAIVYSFTARLYGQRRAKRKTERIAAELRGEEDGDAAR